MEPKEPKIIMRRWLVCRENGWTSGRPSEWHPFPHQYDNPDTAESILEILKDFNRSIRGSAEFKLEEGSKWSRKY